jgi:isopenicillin N synthase-like dioxygenase
VNSPETGIPVLSLHEFNGRRGAFAERLGRAWREFGFVGITDHGIDDSLIEQAYSAMRGFFALPTETKRKYHRPGIGGARGYTGFGIEQAKGHSVPDLKEFWHVGREIEADNPHPGILHPNVWPDEVAGFRDAMLDAYHALEAVGNRVLSAAAIDLGLAPEWFADKTDHGNSILRPLHYPPIEHAPEGAVRAAEHEDINLITLLVGSKEQGLEILTRDGRWIAVTTLPGTIVVNVGDMLQRLTNHIYPSTTHRVVNPPGEAARKSRYSIPFFLHPNPDFLIGTLPSCVDADNPDRYPEPITANDYLVERLREIRLI